MWVEKGHRVDEDAAENSMRSEGTHKKDTWREGESCQGRDSRFSLLKSLKLLGIQFLCLRVYGKKTVRGFPAFFISHPPQMCPYYPISFPYLKGPN